MTPPLPPLDGKTFKASVNSANGEVGMETLFVDGAIKTGICRSTLSFVADGKVGIQEKWQWTCDDLSEGESTLIEL